MPIVPSKWNVRVASSVFIFIFSRIYFLIYLLLSLLTFVYGNTCMRYNTQNTQMEILRKSMSLSVPQVPVPSSRDDQKLDYQTSVLYLDFPRLLFILGIIPYQFIEWYTSFFFISWMLSIGYMNHFFLTSPFWRWFGFFLIICYHRQYGHEELCMYVLFTC